MSFRGLQALSDRLQRARSLRYPLDGRVKMPNLNHPGAVDSTRSKLQAASVGIIGLGRMGQVFGELLIGSGAQVTAYDRDTDRVQALARGGATPASGVRDFAECDMVLTSLPDDDAVRAVVLSES